MRDSSPVPPSSSAARTRPVESATTIRLSRLTADDLGDQRGAGLGREAVDVDVAAGRLDLGEAGHRDAVERQADVARVAQRVVGLGPVVVVVGGAVEAHRRVGQVVGGEQLPHRRLVVQVDPARGQRRQVGGGLEAGGHGAAAGDAGQAVGGGEIAVGEVDVVGALVELDAEGVGSGAEVLRHAVPGDGEGVGRLRERDAATRRRVEVVPQAGDARRTAQELGRGLGEVGAAGCRRSGCRWR